MELAVNDYAMTSKKIILIVATIFLATLFSVSYVYAQTAISGSVNSTNVSNSKPTSSLSNNVSHVIPYHPRDPVSYYAEKQRLYNETRNWEKTHVSSQTQLIPKSSLVRPSPLSGVNPSSGFDGHNAASSGGFDPPDVQVAVGPNHIMELVNVKGEIWNKTTAHSFQNVTLGYGIMEQSPSSRMPTFHYLSRLFSSA